MSSKKLLIESEIGNGADRIDELPDAVLMGVLSLLPMNQAAMAGTLSRRWRRLSAEHMSIRRELDFVGYFRHRHSPEQFVEKVNRCLQLHTVSKVERLHVSVQLPETCSLDLERWVAFAARKGVEDLALDFAPNGEEKVQEIDGIWTNNFAMESTAFAAAPGTLISISLTRCDLSPDFDFSPLSSHLRRASFRGLNIKIQDLHNLLSFCSVLESLRLFQCQQIESVVVGDDGNSRLLKELVIANCTSFLAEVSISAPSLRSFQYQGVLNFDFEFHDISGLEGALLSCVDGNYELPDHDPITGLQAVSHVKILTVCSFTPTAFSFFAGHPNVDIEGLSVPLNNLKELQLLMSCLTNETLGHIYDFFGLCPMPLLEQLFIRLPGAFRQHPDNEDPLNPPPDSFNHLKAVKITNFNGTEPELKLTLFFLESAPLLEKLVLVAPRSPSPSSPDRESLKLKLATLASNSSSPSVQLVFCESSEDSSGLNPTHMETYSDWFWG